MKLARIGVLAVTAVLVIAGCSGSSSSGGGTKTLKIGTELPMSGAETANGEPTANGVKLAIKQANAKSTVPGYTLDINVQDDAVNGAHDPQQGATNMHTLVADTSVVGVVGPFNSSVAQAEIPISNAAGLTQCSPANTNTGLTYPPDSAQYRPNNPDKINYIRVAAPDSIQGPAGADYVYNDLGAKSVYILDDTETFGVGVGDTFAKQFKADGGTVTKRDSAPKSTTDYTPLFTAAAAAKPAAVYLAGTTPTGMGLALKQGRTVAGFETIPFMGPDGVADLGPGGTEGATITIAGAGGPRRLRHRRRRPRPAERLDVRRRLHGGVRQGPRRLQRRGLRLRPGDHRRRSRRRSRQAPPTRGASARPSASNSVSGNSFDTVIGSITFDKNGDITTPFMSFYKVDLTAAGGKGDWIYVKQQAFTDPNK